MSATGLITTLQSNLLPPRRRREVLLLAGHSVREDADKIGWLPWQFYESKDASGELVAVCRDGELVGYCAFSVNPVGREAKIVQTWVRRDARQIEHGRALMGRVARCAGDRGAAWLTCWVAEDLEAMRFWPAVGFRRIARRLGRGDALQMSRLRRLTQFCRATRGPAKQENPTWQTPEKTTGPLSW